jgi:hypothetical protein
VFRAFCENPDPVQVFMIKISNIVRLGKNMQNFGKKSIILFLVFYEGLSSYRRSLPRPQKEHSAVPNMKYLHLFSFLWVVFVSLDQDPNSQFLSRSTYGETLIITTKAADNEQYPI